MSLAAIEQGYRRAGTLDPKRVAAVCDCGSCQSCKMRIAWRDGRFAGRKHVPRWDTWTREEDEFLSSVIGTAPLEEVAERISWRFGTPRTVAALACRCTRLGLSRWTHGISLTELEAVLGLGHRAIVKWWVTPGLLPSKRWEGRGPNRGWWFDEADVERFIRESGYAYDWTAMQPRHRLTRVAELVNRTDPWRTLEDLRTYLGIAQNNVKRWLKRGLVPHRRRAKGGPGTGLIVIRGRDFPAIRAAIALARTEALANSRERFRRMRRSRVKADTPSGMYLRRLLFACARCGRIIERPATGRFRGRVDIQRRRLLCERHGVSR